MTQGPIKAVLVGCGNMSNAWLRPIANIPDVQMVGLVDLNPAAAQKRAAEHHLPESVVFASLGEAIARTKPDVVFDVTIPAAHKAVTLEALAAGCHVLGEKPMAESMADAREMTAAARKAGRLYAVIQNRRYEPHVRRVKQLVDSQAVGKVNEIHSDFFMAPHFGGFREQMAHPLIVDMAIHTFDAARYMTGADPLAVYCHAFNPAHSWFQGDASAIAIFEMTDGLVYCYRGSWCAQGHPTPWNASWRLIASQGTILWDGKDDVKAEHVPRAEGETRLVKPGVALDVPPLTVEHQAHDGLIRDFVRCARTGEKPMTHCDDNIKSLAMVTAAVESARTQQRVEVKW